MVWLQVAPLRVRPADVADLQKFFVRGIAKSRGQGPLALTPEAVLQLESYSFPGNIKVCKLALTLSLLSLSDQSIQHALIGVSLLEAPLFSSLASF